MNSKPYRDILDSAAAESLSRNANLWPKISAQLERKTLIMKLRARPILAILIALLILLALSGAVYALGRVFGYIPGIGLVDQSAPIRVLTEPVSQTRDGVTVTVEEAVLSLDKTVVVFTVDNIPLDKLSSTPWSGKCIMMPNTSAELKLPDGSTLQITGGGGGGQWGVGSRSRFIYAPIPADVYKATLFIPCIQGTSPGLPENWELPLRFVPAPADMTALPVIEYTPLPEPNAGTAQPNPITITKAIDAGDSYILLGEFAPPTRAGVTWPSNELSLTDGKGQDVPWEYPQDIDQPALSSDKQFVEAWSIKFAKGFTPPLNIKYSSRYSYPAPSTVPLEFEFDAGTNPQSGDEWQLNKEFNVDGHVFTLTTIDVIIGTPCAPLSGYGFTFTSSDTTISTVSAAGIDGYIPPPLDSYAPAPGCGGGGGGMDAGGLGTTWVNSLGFAEMPEGKLKVKLSVELYSKPQEWTLQWQPEDLSSNSAALTDAPQACLTLDSWQAALANPAPIPSDLTGKLIASGRIVEDGKDPSLDNSGMFTINLDGNNKQVVGQGVMPSLSPDGAQAVYENWDGGLYLADLASGEKHLIPNTTKGDTLPRWSPDGRRIAFIRYEDVYRGIISVSIINLDGTGLQRVADEITGEPWIDWTSDGTGLFYGEVTKDGMLLKKLDIASGVTSDLFITHAVNRSHDVTFNISPDGNKITVFDQVGVSMADGLYIAKLDVSVRKLIALSSVVINPIWSPDGKWLMVNVWGNSRWTFALVNVQDCRIIPLSWDADTVYTWIP